MNQNPEQLAKDAIDIMLVVSGWTVQSKKDFNLGASTGMAVGEYSTSVLDYFDAFQIGLTATPDNRAFGYFNQKLACDYGNHKAAEDGVQVQYNVFEIQT